MLLSFITGCTIDWHADVDYVNAKNIDELKGCTIIDGHLRILGYSISGYLFKGVMILRMFIRWLRQIWMKKRLLYSLTSFDFVLTKCCCFPSLIVCRPNWQAER